MSDFESLVEAFGAVGGDQAILGRNDIAHLVVVGHKVLSSHSIDGLSVETQETCDGISVQVKVAERARITQPVHMCFGIVQSTGTQRIQMDVRLEKGAHAHFIAHCLFPEAKRIQHIMDAQIIVGMGAALHYEESHFHGPHGGIEVIPKAHVTVGKDGQYSSEFTLVTGLVGMLDIDYTVEAGENAVTELTTRVFGHRTDRIKIREAIILAGRNSRGLIKTRIALEHEASAEVTGITEGNAPGARGHVDCMEIVKDRAVAKAIPVVSVTSPLAKVTHEAAIGSVDKRQLETLMSHGLDSEEAVDLIVRGILK